jgi:NitT/TauT family transport system substrate-binding protein
MRGSDRRGGASPRLAPGPEAPGAFLAAWRDAASRARTFRGLPIRPRPRRLGGVARRGLAAALLVLLGSVPGPAAAEGRKVKVGVLKLSSSAPIFLGVERGTFREFGIEPELVYFQAAQPVAVAIAAGELEVGATGLTAGLYNVVTGGEKVWVVADKGREWPGYPLTALLVQKDGPIRSVRDLKGRKVGITQLGSTFHYMLGNLLEQEGLSLADVEPAPLRTLGAMAEALQARRVDAILIPQPFAGTAVENGSGRILFWVGDKLPYQVAAIFYSKAFAQDRERAIAFMKGYVKAARLFFDAVLALKDGRPPAGPAYDEVVNVTARYTGAAPEVVRVGFSYQDRDARLDVADIARQLAWYHRAGMVTAPLQPRDLVDGSFLEEALRALPR